VFFLLRHSKEHQDFWNFLKKYQAIMRKRGQQAKIGTSDSDSSNKLSEIFKLPLRYDKRWRLNFVYKPNKLNMMSYDALGLYFFINLSIFIYEIYFQNSFLGNQLKFDCSDEQFQEFEFIIHLFLDYRQKENVIFISI
jgi:hypothetical protein